MDNQERRRAIKSRNLEKKEAKSEETPDRQEENLVSGMKFISNIEEWKRRMPVRWDDRNVIAREDFAVPAYPPEDTSASEKVNDLLKEKDKEK